MIHESNVRTTGLDLGKINVGRTERNQNWEVSEIFGTGRVVEGDLDPVLPVSIPPTRRLGGNVVAACVLAQRGVGHDGHKRHSITVRTATFGQIDVENSIVCNVARIAGHAVASHGHGQAAKVVVQILVGGDLDGVNLSVGVIIDCFACSDGGCGEQAQPVPHECRAKGRDCFNVALDVFQIPVAAQFRTACLVITGRHVSAGEVTKGLDQRLSVLACCQVAAIEQEVAVFSECIAPDSHVCGIDVKAFEVHGGAAQREGPTRPVRD